MLGTNYNTKINFIPKGNQNGTNTIKRLYQVSAWVINEDTNEPVPYTNITVLGKTLDTNGIAHVVLDEASTNAATPSVNGVTNFYFNVSATRIMITPAPRFTGQLSARSPATSGTNDIGWKASIYDAFTNKIGTTSLGQLAPFNFFLANGDVLRNFKSVVETTATWPYEHPDFTNGWTLQRDVAGNAWEYRLQQGQVVQIQGAQKSFTPGDPPAGGNDNNADKDEIPDAKGAIFSADAPGPRIPVNPAANPVFVGGDIIAYRMFAHEWVLWNGALVSEPIKWHTFITIRLGDTDWEYVGLNEITATDPNDPESPNVTKEELDAIPM